MPRRMEGRIYGKEQTTPKHVLKLPDLEQSKSAVLNSLTSQSSQRTYDHAIREFIEWYCSDPRLAFKKTVVTRYRISLEQKHYASTTIDLRLAAVRRLAYEAADCGLLKCRLGCRHPPGEGCKAFGVACRQLAHGGTGQTPVIDGAQCESQRQARLCHIGAGLAPVFAIKPAVNWSKFSSYWGTSLFKQRSGTWVANSAFATR